TSVPATRRFPSISRPSPCGWLRMQFAGWRSKRPIDRRCSGTWLSGRPKRCSPVARNGCRSWPYCGPTESTGVVFETVFKESLSRLQTRFGQDHVRWYDLLRMVLTWALYRRPPQERDRLLAAAEASQSEALRQREVKTMGQTIAEALIEEGEA